MANKYKKFTKFGDAQYWTSVEQLYKDRHGYYLSLASRHLFNKDYANDAVNDAFVKTIEYFKKHKDKKVRAHIVAFQVLKACKKINKKFSPEIPFGLMNTDKE